MWQRYGSRESPFRVRGQGREVPDAGHRPGVVWVKDCLYACDGGRPWRRRGTGRGAGAGHVRQSRDRVHDRPDRARTRFWGRRGAGHGGRAAARRAGGRVLAADRPVVIPPQVRPAVRGALLRHGAARHGRGHPEVPGLGPDQGHRPGDGRADGGALRRGHHARHRRRAGPADRGRRAGPQAHRDDRRRLGRAEGDQGGDDLPARRRRVDVAGGADLQEIRRRLGLASCGPSRTGWPRTCGASGSRPRTRSPPRSASPPTARSGSRPGWPTPCPRRPTTATATCPPPT